MARFYGKVGYVKQEETSPGIWEEISEEKNYYGDITKAYRRLDGSKYLNDNISVSNNISIVADAYAYNNIFAIRYVIWMGSKWKVTNVEVQRPRLILTLGGIYNGN